MFAFEKSYKRTLFDVIVWRRSFELYKQIVANILAYKYVQGVDLDVNLIERARDNRS